MAYSHWAEPPKGGSQETVPRNVRVAASKDTLLKLFFLGGGLPSSSSHCAGAFE
eukprot:CAMPEP_0170574606 /NCGR_PEP_ID=MMETSP0224-20130122/3392_1 /TAXON_ID=285029 /ORGANISM="Togula jolla, Strain CCCM 725" /LENGTH=53 /DNA_ID=CAMNT_0010897279 /DNA_START=173 /DNA_END=334 /DNA_ORIENTATION=+